MRRFLPVLLSVFLAGCIVDPTPPRDQWLRDTNAVRSFNGRAPVAWETLIEDMAQDWAAHMCATRSLAHRPLALYLDGPYGAWTELGENILRGQRSDWSVAHNAWVASPPHFANIIGPFTVFGVGHVACSDGFDYWVENFARGY